MKRKLIPPFVMLLAGLIASIRTYMLHYDLKRSLTIILVVLVIFYLLGSLVKFMLDVFEKDIAQKAMDEGEVIEKQADGESETTEDGEAVNKEAASKESSDKEKKE